MDSVIFEFECELTAGGVVYRARACGTEMDDGRWEGWVEFLPPRGGTVLLSPRETIQPAKASLIEWAGELTTHYLEGSLHRALDRRLFNLRSRQTKPPRQERTRKSESY